MDLSILKRGFIFLCLLMLSVCLFVVLPQKCFADELNNLYEEEEEVMVINDDVGSNECDHACLIISAFLDVAATANAVISLFFLIYGCKQHEKVKEKMIIMRQSAERIDYLRNTYPKGTRLIMHHMDDPNPVEYGEHGTVRLVDDMGVIHVDWDSGRTLGVIPGVDSFKRAKETEKDKGRER